MDIVFVLGLLSANAFADNYLSRCARLLGTTIQHLDPDPTKVAWGEADGLGNFNMKATGALPINDETEAAHARRAVMPWFHSITTAPSMDVARLKDSSNIASKQVMYLITDQNISDLQTSESLPTGRITPEEYASRRVQAMERFDQVFRDGKTKLIYFEQPDFDPSVHDEVDTTAAKPKKSIFGGVPVIYFRNTNQPVPRVVVEVSPDQARNFLFADEMGVTEDNRGTLFRQYGWFQLYRRGVQDVARSLRMNQGNTNPESTAVRDINKMLQKLDREGWRFSGHADLERAMELVKGMVHNVRGQVVEGDGIEANSRFHDIHVEQSFRKAYAKGDAYVHGYYGPDGVMYATALGYYGDNRFLVGETPAAINAPRPQFGDQPPGVYKAVELVKAILLRQFYYSIQAGYAGMDQQVVSNLTGQLGAYYVTPREFLARAYSGPPPPRPRPGQYLELPTPLQLHAIR